MLAEAASAATNAKSQIVAALQQAAVATGSDFHYLLSTATRESGLKPQAQSSTSSASGLFQFVGQTWLGLVKKYGAQYGLGSLAGSISQGPDGHFHAASDADRQAILALRNNPQIASLMAGHFANDMKSALEGSLGRRVCNGELYAAHFLGPDAACRLIRLSQDNPSASAATAFPQAAGANKSVFYHSNGTPKTAREVYAWATKQVSAAGPDVASAVKIAQPDRAAGAHPYNSAPSWNGDDAWSLLGSVMFGSSSDTSLMSMASLSNSPFALTPDVLDLLASLKPDDAGQKHAMH